MDAWEQLISKSTIPSGDAWEHLNNQEGGGGTGETIYVPVSALTEVEVDSAEASAASDLFVVEAENIITADILEVTQYADL